MISDRKLKELEELCKNASKGPWTICDETDKWPDIAFEGEDGFVHLLAESVQIADAQFIVAARRAIPELIEAIRLTYDYEGRTPGGGFKLVARG